MARLMDGWTDFADCFGVATGSQATRAAREGES